MVTGEQYTDAELIQSILQGETGLFEILARRNNPFLYKTGRSYHYTHEDTLDLMQETFIDAYKSLSLFENRSSFKTWIIKIMLNRCFRKKQTAGFIRETGLEINDYSKPMFSTHTDSQQTVSNRELGHIIEQALHSIPHAYRMVFTLREMNGLSVIETAEALDISEPNVKIRLNRAKTMLRKEIEKSYTSAEVYEFNLIYCDAIVERVMHQIHSL